MKSRLHLLVIALMLASFSGAVARPLRIPSLAEVWDLADLVAIIAPELN